MNIIITILFVLLFSSILSFLGKKIKIPMVVILISCGLIIDIPLIKDFFIEPNTQFLFGLGDIALICLMFLAGMESSWNRLCKERKDSIFIAIFAATVPLLLGFSAFIMLGFPVMTSFIIGICMSITAEATKVRVLLDLGKLRTRVGSAMVGAGIIDDILGLFLFILITLLFNAFQFLNNLLIGGVIVAFFTGVLVQMHIGREHRIIKDSENILIWAIVPFFFVSVGLHLDIGSMILNPSMISIIIIIAIIGKLAGSLLTKPFTNFKWKQLYLIGWAMNSRGAIEIALALIAFRSNIISIELYSSLVIMALVTTLMFPFIITKIIKRNPEIMN